MAATFNELAKLKSAVEASRSKLREFCKIRADAVRQFVGSHYGSNGTQERVPINFLELAVTIYNMSLAARCPRALVVPRVSSLKAEAATLGLALNHLAKEIRLGTALRRAVRDALFGMAVVEVGSAAGRTVEIDGEPVDVGQPFADNVSLDDFVADMSAKNWERVEFMGHTYRVPLVDLQDNEFYDQDVVRTLESLGMDREDIPAGERASDIGTGRKEYSDETEYRKHVDLLQLYLPYENLIVTVPAGGNWDKPLNMYEWQGPERGPYHLLGFGEVPDNLMPLAPVDLWLDLHYLANRLFVKLGRQADRQKNIGGVAPEAASDAEKIIQATDGELINIKHPEGIKAIRLGGIDPQNLGFLLQIQDIFSYFGGNLDAIGGLGAMSETVGQDQLLTASASKRIQYMQDTVYEFAGGIEEALAWYLMYNPLIELPLIKQTASGREIPVTYRAWEREGDYLDYNYEIVPYSMQYESPRQRLNGLLTIFTQLFIPLAPVMAQQGIGINYQALSRQVSELSNLPELNDLLIFSQPAPNPGEIGPVGQPPRQSPVTRRENVRINRSGATLGGKRQILAQALFGGNPQQAEREAVS